MPGPRGARGDLRRARDARGAALRLLSYLRPHAVTLGIVMLLTLGSSLFSVLQPSVTGSITTALFDGVMQGAVDWGRITRLLVTLAAIFVTAQCFQMLQGIRNEIDAKVHRLPLRYYDARANGEILSVITNDVDMIEGVISRNLTQ